MQSLETQCLSSQSNTLIQHWENITFGNQQDFGVEKKSMNTAHTFMRAFIKKSTCIFSRFPNGGQSTERRFCPQSAMQAVGNTSLVRQIGEIPMMPSVQCSASQYQDPDTVRCSAKMLRDPSFTCLPRCSGQTCPGSLSGLTLSKERHGVTQSLDLGIWFTGSPKKQNRQSVCVCA